MNPFRKPYLLALRLCLATVFSMRPALAADDGLSVTLCHGFGCRLEVGVTFSQAEWVSVAALMQASDGREERRQLKAALGYLEYLAGGRSPLHRDLAGNAEAGAEGQLDCIDESINASRFLALLEAQGLMRFHRVADRAYRRSLITQHWASQVEEVATGRHYVYDTWFNNNGRPPVMVPSERWHNLWLTSRAVNLTLADLSQGRDKNNANRK